MNAQLTSTTHFFHVPVRVCPNSQGGYDISYDFNEVDVTYAQSVLLYELIEAPVKTLLTKPSISPPGPFEPFVAAHGLMAGFVDSDGATTQPITTEKYSVTLHYTVDGKPYHSDPQVINNPIKR